jgi:hypothetical protein
VGQARFFGTITNSYATGPVDGTGAYYVGGLTGQQRFVTLVNTYATGSVVGNFIVGGLVGYLDGTTITNSWSSGAVSGNSSVGGLVGIGGGAVTNSYWDTATSNQSTSSGGSPLDSAQMKQQSNFSSWDFDSVWTLYEGVTNPLLRSLMTPVTVTANNDSKTYDGLAYSGNNGATYSTPFNKGMPVGTLTYSGSSQGAINTGNYVITPGGLQSDQRYLINFADGTLSVNPYAVDLTGSRPYDGTTDMAASLFSFGTLVGLETLTLSGSGTMMSKDVGAAKVVAPDSLTLGDGTGGGLASNYTLSGGTQTASITAVPLSITANPDLKTYDGIGYSGGNGVAYEGFVSDDSAGMLGGALVYGGTAQGATNAGEYIITPDGLTSGNYLISYSNGKLTIKPAILTVTANAASMEFGAALPPLSGIISGFVNGETQANTTNGTLTFTTPATSESSVGLYPINGSGLTTNGNYEIVAAAGNATALSINPQSPTKPPPEEKDAAVEGAIANVYSQGPASGCAGSGGSIACGGQQQFIEDLNLTISDQGVRIPLVNDE